MTGDLRFDAVLRWLAGQASGPVVVLCAEAPDAVASGRLGVRLAGCLHDTPAYQLIDLALAAGRPTLLAVEGCARGASDLVASTAHLVGPTRLVVGAAEASGVRGDLVDAARPLLARRGLVGASEEPPIVHAAADDAGRLVESLRIAGVAAGATPGPAVGLTASVCTACGLCVRTCPHEALALAHDGSRSVLTHLPDRCAGERVCEAVCPVAGLADGGQLSWDETLAGPRVLIAMTSRACRRCRARTTRPDGYCPPCALRRENPFGSWVPARGPR